MEATLRHFLARFMGDSLQKKHLRAESCSSWSNASHADTKACMLERRLHTQLSICYDVLNSSSLPIFGTKRHPINNSISKQSCGPALAFLCDSWEMWRCRVYAISASLPCRSLSSKEHAILCSSSLYVCDTCAISPTRSLGDCRPRGRGGVLVYFSG